MSRRHAAEKREVLPDPKFKENILVREALELFDATIHSVRELPDTTTNPGGAADDV